MKILHIIDGAYFETHTKTISELILALSDFGVEQKIYTSDVADLGWLSNVCEIVRWKSVKSGKLKTFSNKLKTMFLLSSFRPDIMCKWGLDARKIVWGSGGIQVSFLNEREPLKTFENTDYIMTNSDDVLSFVKVNGYSGARSFLLPPFVYEYKNSKPVSKRDFFIPEKANAIYLASVFKRDVGFENAFDALAVANDKYFFIAGNGPDREYVEDLALRANVKSRSRFIPEIERSAIVYPMVDFAFLPFEDSENAKYILEAMLHNRFIVAVKNSVSEEFIVEGKTGFFVPKRDMYLIKKKLKEIMALGDDEKRKVTENAFLIAQNYVAKKIVPGYIQMFEELIRKYNSRRNLLNN